MAQEDLKGRIRNDMNAARREGDRTRSRLFSTLLSDIRNREIELGHDLDDQEVVQVLARAIKMRHEAAEQMASRPELADRERHEAELIGRYMPPQMSEEEIRAKIVGAIESGARDLGAVMGQVMPQVRGRADGREVNRIAREELETRGSEA